MTFIQTEFLWFFAIVLTVYWALPKREWQNLFLALASAVFYGWVHPWFLILLYISAAVDYFAALGMEKRPDRKGWILFVSLAVNTGILGYYKYFDFFVENAAAALDALGVHNTLQPLGILLPPGISFYTFQSMAYSIDVYRGELKPRKNLLDYMLAVSLFPHLVAGPVQRASNLLLQAETVRRFDWNLIRSGFALAIWGAFKKVVVADSVSPYVDKVFSLEHASGPLIWAATLGFAVQILADFSGYTDIARGCARMLGFELMENFKQPYLATNPSEFWKRWHVSFSSWIRDYLYIPFGGSRGGFWRTTLATFGAMGLSGLWHGASWNFVIWGCYHAALITGYRLVTPRIPQGLRSFPGSSVIAVLIMFGFTNLGWLLFRETDGKQLWAHLTASPFAASHDEWVATVTLLAVTATVSVPQLLALAAERWIVPRLSKTEWYLPVQTTMWAVYAVCLFVFVRMSGMDFIYFQF
jgi:D-alanyl-lipoteichoic acid acyltransferase DltB (MBOAT superfamily)